MNSNDKKVTFFGIGVLILMLGLSLLFGSNATGGEGRGNGHGMDPFKDNTLYSETIKLSGDLDEGATSTHDIDTAGKLIKNLTAKLTWEDESDLPGRPRIRQYNNQPDTFGMTISDISGNFSEEGTGTNPEGSEGTIELDLSINNTVLKDMVNSETSWTISVDMVSAGMWSPRIGIIGFTDPGNAYDLDVTIEYYDLVEIVGE